VPTPVRLKLASGSGEGYEWLEQVFNINISLKVDCMYDPIRRGTIYR
jgi:hypothetical protein